MFCFLLVYMLQIYQKLLGWLISGSKFDFRIILQMFEFAGSRPVKAILGKEGETMKMFFAVSAHN